MKPYVIVHMATSLDGRTLPSRWRPQRENATDVSLALETLNRELGVKRLLLEGGGLTNGNLLRAGLVDELSLLLCPFVDGTPGAPTLFEATHEAERASIVQGIERMSSEALDDGVMWLRYRIRNG